MAFFLSFRAGIVNMTVHCTCLYVIAGREL